MVFTRRQRKELESESESSQDEMSDEGSKKIGKPVIDMNNIRGSRTRKRRSNVNYKEKPLRKNEFLVSSSSEEEVEEEDAYSEPGEEEEEQDPAYSDVESDEVFEDEEEVIEKIVGCRHHPDNSEDEDPEEWVYQYLVKFKGKSYRHVQWVGPEQIEEQSSNGKKKINDFHMKYDFPGMDEDEIIDLVNPNFYDVDRVLTESATSERPISLVKWKGLNYGESTWEFSDTVDESKLIEAQERNKVPRPSDFRIPPRPRVKDFNQIENEEFEFKDDRELRSYQLEGVNWLIYSYLNRRNTILADEMGLGKTIQTVSMLYYLMKHLHNRGPFLIVAPLSTIQHWKREVENWTTMNAIIFHGTQADRDVLKTHEIFYYNSRGRQMKEGFKFNILITTYEMCLTEKSFLGKFHWQYLVVDEGHKLKNKNSKLLAILNNFTTEHKLLLTGTPIQNDMDELFTLLHYLNPDVFEDREDFLAKYGEMTSNEEVKELHELIRPYLLRRLKEDVEESIPPKEEIVVEIVPTTVQKKYYRAILEKKRDFLRQGCAKGNVPRLVNILMEIRKVCNHPFLISGAENSLTQGQSQEEVNEMLIKSSSKLIFTDKLLFQLKKEGHKVLIFSQMVRCLNILEDYLQYRKFNYVRLDGSIRGDLRQHEIDKFNDPNDDVFVFLVSTRAGGVGLNLQTADTVIIFDSDWNPQADIQAMARAHRIGQTNEVKVYRLLTKNTKEFEMFQRASRKLGLDRAVLSDVGHADFNKTNKSNVLDKDEIETLLRHGAYVAMKDDTEEEKQLLEEDIDSILKRSSKVVRWEKETSENKGISHFNKASFNFGGENIDLDDVDFWSKVLPQGNDAESLRHILLSDIGLSSEEDIQKWKDDVQSLVDKAIDEKNRYVWSEESEQLGQLLVIGMYSSKLSPELREQCRIWCDQVDRNRSRQKVETKEDEEEEQEDDAVESHKKGGFYKAERDRLKILLYNFGYGRWKEFQETSLVKKTVHQIHGFADHLLQNFQNFFVLEATKVEKELNEISVRLAKLNESPKTEESKSEEHSLKLKQSSLKKKVKDMEREKKFIRTLILSECKKLKSTKDQEEQSDKMDTSPDVEKLQLKTEGKIYLPVKSLNIRLPAKDKMKGKCVVQLILTSQKEDEVVELEEESPSNEEEQMEQLSQEEKFRSRISIHRDRIYCSYELSDEEKHGEYFKITAPGFHSKFYIQFSSENYESKSDFMYIRGYHPQIDLPFQGALCRNHKSILKKMKLCNDLKNFVNNIASKITLKDLPELKLKRPAEWWDKQCDLDLLQGVYAYGLSKTSEIPNDPKYCFKEKLKIHAETHGSTRGKKDELLNQFPKLKVLQTRVQKLLETLLDQKSKPNDAPKKKPEKKKKTKKKITSWSKSEQTRFRKYLCNYGTQCDTNGRPQYEKLISGASLSKTKEHVQQYLKHYILYCSEVTGMKYIDPDPTVSVIKPLSEKEKKELFTDGTVIATRVINRIRVLRNASKYVFPHLDKPAIKSALKAKHGFPSFWNRNYDIEMLKAVEKHGFNLLHLLNDEEFPLLCKLPKSRKEKLKDRMFIKRLDSVQQVLRKKYPEPSTPNKTALGFFNAGTKTSNPSTGDVKKPVFSIPNSSPATPPPHRPNRIPLSQTMTGTDSDGASPSPQNKRKSTSSAEEPPKKKMKPSPLVK